jgi:hypothetical protein
MPRFSRLSLLGIALTLLLAGAGGVCPTASAQQPTLDPDTPVASLDEAVRAADADSTLVGLAVALQRARADTKISFHAYRTGVRLFQRHHPGFYGNFFGDPFYATYDVRYQRLTRQRQLAASDIEPRNSVRSTAWFFCWPSSYDPAFGGQCRGFKFAASDFWLLPSGPAFAQRTPRPEDRLRDRGDRVSHATLRRPPRSAPSTPDTAGRSTPDVPTPSPGAEKPASSTTATEAVDAERAIDAVSTTTEINVPDEASSRMQREASALRQEEVRMRIRRTIEEEFGGRNALTPEQRTRLAARVAERSTSRDQHSGRSSQPYDPAERVEQARDRIERIAQIRERAESRRVERDRDRAERPTSFRDRSERRVPDRSASDRTSPPERSSPSHSPTRDTPDRATVDRDASDDSEAN